MYPCPCCGYEVFAGPPGTYEICPICFWEDDLVQLAFPDLAGGANKCSLIEAQQNFERVGVCEPRFKDQVRSPNASDKRDARWRRLQPATDRYLKQERSEDHQKWQAVKDLCDVCLYYWLPEYWLT